MDERQTRYRSVAPCRCDRHCLIGLLPLRECFCPAGLPHWRGRSSGVRLGRDGPNLGVFDYQLWQHQNQDSWWQFPSVRRAEYGRRSERAFVQSNARIFRCYMLLLELGGNAFLSEFWNLLRVARAKNFPRQKGFVRLFGLTKPLPWEAVEIPSHPALRSKNGRNPEGGIAAYFKIP
jgi:hypothetical protein